MKVEEQRVEHTRTVVTVGEIVIVAQYEPTAATWWATALYDSRRLALSYRCATREEAIAAVIAGLREVREQIDAAVLASASLVLP